MALPYLYKGNQVDLEDSSEEVKALYGYLVEINKTINKLNRELSIQHAASVTINNRIVDVLDSSEAVEEVAQDEDVVEKKPATTTRKRKTKKTVNKKAS